MYLCLYEPFERVVASAWQTQFIERAEKALRGPWLDTWNRNRNKLNLYFYPSFTEAASMPIQHLIFNVCVCECVSVCAIVQDPKPRWLETSSQRAHEALEDCATMWVSQHWTNLCSMICKDFGPKSGTNTTPPGSEDGVFNCSEQLRLSVDSGAPSRMARSSIVHSFYLTH